MPNQLKSPTNWILLLLLVNLLQGYGQQGFHSLSIGYTYSELRNISQAPNGTGSVGILHVTEALQGKSGGNLAYDFSFPLGDMFYATTGVGLTWLRSGLVYSTRFYGLSCPSCTQNTEEERLGIDATYSNYYLRIPLSVSIPFTERRKAFLKVGVDMMWLVQNRSTWDFLEVTWLYQRQDSAWSSQIVNTQLASENP